jgi:2-isopropylmalate synthase
MRTILFFDTTLRDGLKSPGTVLTLEEKLRVAKQLARLQVDVLEVGFPAASAEQFEAAELISKEIRGPIVAALARPTNPRDFEIAWNAVRHNPRPRLHTFVPASREYRDHFLGKNPLQTAELAASAVKAAQQYTSDVEFSLMDAFRAPVQEVIDLVRSAVSSGAGTINLADTVGYATPSQVVGLFQALRRQVDGFDRVVFSVHCHNDLGLAVANSLAAVAEGARQVHCTINGIGERAGNTALEELAALLAVHGRQCDAQQGLDLSQIYPTSRLVRRLTGVSLRAHKPVVGANAFTHEVLVPQLSDREETPPYETLRPEQLGIRSAVDALTLNTSPAEFRERFLELGYEFQEAELAELFAAFGELAERKEQVFDADLELLANARTGVQAARYHLQYLKVSAGSIAVPNATVQLEIDGQLEQDAGFGHGPVDAAFRTIFKITKRHPKLVRYELTAVTPGSDAQGEVTVRLEENGLVANGRGIATDIVLASVRALVDGLNKLDWIRGEPVISEFTDDESLMPIL